MVKRPRNLDPPHPGLSSLSIGSARYVGSGEHKDERWWGGLPESPVDAQGDRYRVGKQDTTICPLVNRSDQQRATQWVRAALRANQVKYKDGNTQFPDRIWYRDKDGQVWEGRCVNVTQGHYKGWPISESERREVFG